VYEHSTGLPDQHLNEKPSNTRKKPKISQTNVNLFLILSSHEKLQIQVITTLPTGMIGTYGINLVQCEVFWHFWRCSEVFATSA